MKLKNKGKFIDPGMYIRLSLSISDLRSDSVAMVTPLSLCPVHVRKPDVCNNTRSVEGNRSVLTSARSVRL